MLHLYILIDSHSSQVVLILHLYGHFELKFYHMILLFENFRFFEIDTEIKNVLNVIKMPV